MNIPAQHLLLYCRAGFEAECAAEIMSAASAQDFHGYVRAKSGKGFVLFTSTDGSDTSPLLKRIRFDQLIFPRQLIAACAPIYGLSPEDRISPIMALVEQWETQFSEVIVETADNEICKPLLQFCKKFGNAFAQALKRKSKLKPSDSRLPRLHLFFTDSQSVHAGISLPGNSSPLYMGIPRLKFPREAPSRSTLKLEEALLTFLSPEERETRLAPGMTAVDLGAAPGGWTWQLVKRSIHVYAVDNGPMDPALMESGLVTHCKEDGFRYKPKNPVNWLVCDMVEQPARIAKLMAQWAAEGYCDECVFNLKLPMKKRYAEVQHCREIIGDALLAAGLKFEMGFKQLYHDREEVTGWLRILS